MFKTTYPNQRVLTTALLPAEAQLKRPLVMIGSASGHHILYIIAGSIRQSGES